MGMSVINKATLSSLYMILPTLIEKTNLLKAEVLKPGSTEDMAPKLIEEQACCAGCRPSPAEASPISQIHPLSKMTITFEPMMGF